MSGCEQHFCLPPTDKRVLGRTCMLTCLLFLHVGRCPQVPPTVDNLRESLMAKVEEVRGVHGPQLLLGVQPACFLWLRPRLLPGSMTMPVCNCNVPFSRPQCDFLALFCDHHIPQVLGLEQGVLGPPHRLDVGTEGLVVLNKTPAFARWVARQRGFKASMAGGWPGKEEVTCACGLGAMVVRSPRGELYQAVLHSIPTDTLCTLLRNAPSQCDVT